MTTPARHASIDEWPVVPETEAPRSHGPVRTDIGGAASGIVLGKARVSLLLRADKRERKDNKEQTVQLHLICAREDSGS